MSFETHHYGYFLRISFIFSHRCVFAYVGYMHMCTVTSGARRWQMPWSLVTGGPELPFWGVAHVLNY